MTGDESKAFLVMVPDRHLPQANDGTQTNVEDGEVM